MTNIPKIIHQIWIGPKTAPVHWMSSWKKHHTDWEYRLWDNEAVLNRKWSNQRLVDEYLQKKEWRGIADTVRYEILHEHGGFMPGTDCECVRSCDELFQNDYFTDYAVYENETIRPGLITPLYAAVPKTLFSHTLISALMYQKSGEPWQFTGNLHMQNVYERFSWNTVAVWPSHFFNPWHYTGLKYDGPDKPYGIQHWGSTRHLYS